MHQLLQWSLERHVVVRVRCKQGFVLLVANDGGGEVVKGAKVGDGAVITLLA